MALIDKDSGGDDRINVTSSVGVNGKNLHFDVVVVQALLKFLFNHDPLRWATFIPPEPVGAGELKNTIRAIKEFQNSVRRNPQMGFWVAGDGRVNPVKNGVDFFGPDQASTISALNFRAELLVIIIPSLKVFKTHIEAITTEFPFSAGVALGRFAPLFL